jgi:PAS domain S-box-containing protein
MKKLFPSDVDSLLGLVFYGFIGVVFVLDLSLPSGLAIGFLYSMILIPASMVFADKSFTLRMFLITSALIVFGFLYQGANLTNVDDLVNRSLALVCNGVWSFFCLAFIRQENKLIAQEERFEHILDSAPTGMLITDSRGMIQYANREMERLFQYSRSQLLLLNIDDLVTHSLKSDLPPDPSLQRPAPRPVSLSSIRNSFGTKKDGTKFPLKIGLTATKIHGEIHTIGSIGDLSDRIKFEDEITLLNKELRLNNSQLEQKVRTIADRLKVPLSKITEKTRHIETQLGARNYVDILDTVEAILKHSRDMQTLLNDPTSASPSKKKPIPLPAVSEPVILQRLN